jgi:circadian clock protein KaiC
MTASRLDRVATGVPGLDDVLDGGLPDDRAYMLRGGPGSGKTILGEHFLTAEDDDTALFVSLEESERDLRANAASVGSDLADVVVLDYSPDAEEFADGGSYDVFAPGDRGESLSEGIKAAVDEHAPDRVFVDPLTRLRQFAPDDARFLEEVGSFASYVRERGATLLFTTQPTPDSPDEDLEFLCDGSIELDEAPKGRTVTVRKLRGSSFQRGAHTVRVSTGGMRVYPRLVPDVARREFDAETRSTGVDELDGMLGGGIERGTVTVISGASGVGKSTTATQLSVAAAERGERAVSYLFEESRKTFVRRSESVGMPVRRLEADGSLELREVEALSVSPDEFAAEVREQVEVEGASVVVIDGISGYRMSIRGDDEDLVRELHALCRYLRGMGVTTVLLDDIPAVTGDFEPTSERISYLADAILFLRYLEYRGEVRKAAGVLKKRSSDFERALREFEITANGLALGAPLTDLRGVLTGTPEWPDDDG